MMTEMKDQKELITYTELGKLTNACLKLLSHVDKLSEGNDDRMSDIAGNILGSLRKLLVATTLYKRQVICIAGLQGAGKTTLMRYFYDLDDTLVGTIGVGERVPVLITERKDIRRPMLYSIKIIRKGEEYLEIREEINPKDYETQTHASNESIMYFELFVPFKFIKDSNDDSACFMLLPGHEVEKGDKYYLNNLIEFSVNSSDAAVFVLNQTRLSYEENQTYMRNVEKKFHNQIVYVISQSETTEDDNASTKKTLMDEYAIPDRRIVCSGGYEGPKAYKNDLWKKALMDAINANLLSSSAKRQKNSEYIFNEIDDLRKKLLSLNVLVKQAAVSNNADLSNEAVLVTFDQYKNKLKVRLDKEIKDHFAAAEGESAKLLEEMFDSKNRKLVNEIKRLIFGNNVSEEFTEARKRIQTALVDKNTEKYLPDIYLQKAMDKSLNMLVTDSNKSMPKMIEAGQQGELFYLTDCEQNQNFTIDVRNLLAVHSADEPFPGILCKSHRNLIKSIVELGTYYFSFATAEAISQPNEDKWNTESTNKTINIDEVLAGAKSSQKFMLGIAGMMGVDVIADGTINFIPQIAASIGVSVPVVSAIFGVGILAGAGVVVARDLNQLQRADYSAARTSVHSIYDEFRVNVLTSYDEYMDLIRERVYENLMLIDRNGEKVVAQVNARAEITNAIHLIESIKERCAKSASGMGILPQ